MTRIISFSSAAIAALVLGAFLSAAPAVAAGGNYCLSGDSTMDCSFTSLAQCEATASGGLGECNMVAAGFEQRGTYAFYRAHAAMRGGMK